MTKSTITRERLEWLSQISCRDDIEDIGGDEIRELASMALAAMDSEPVAWTWHYREQWHVTNDERRAEFVAKDGDVAVLPLYRHAQPAPVVSTDLFHTAASAIEDLLTTKDRAGAGVWFDLPFRLRSAANAQPAPVVPEEATPDSIEILASARRRDHAVFQWDEDQRNAAADSWNAFRAAMLQAVPLTNEGDIQAGNSLAQSGCCPAQSQIDHGYRPECECSGCKATARICAELSANSSANPDCWCRTCRPVDLNDMRFVVCPDCGNKRCPRANDHRNACTGSNEPGQEGSAYPDTPQEVKGE